MGQQGDLGLDAEASHLVGAEGGDLHQGLGIRIGLDIGIGDEHRAGGEDDGGHGDHVLHPPGPTDDQLDLLQMATVAADGTADHGVRLAGAQQHGGQGGGGPADVDPGLGGGEAPALGALIEGGVVGLPVGVVLGVHHPAVLVQAQVQAQAGETPLDDGAPTDEDGPGDALLYRLLGGLQDHLLLTLGEDHPPGLLARQVEDALHGHAGTDDPVLHALAVGLQVLDRPGGDAGGHGGGGHRRGDHFHETGVEGLGDQVLRAEAQVLAAIGLADDVRGPGAGQGGDGLDAGALHVLVDLGRATIQGATEQEGEAEDVVDLVGVVGAPGGDDRVRPGGLGLLRRDLRVGVGEGEDQGILRHPRQPGGFEDTASGEAEKDIGIGQGLLQGTQGGIHRIARLVGVHDRRAPRVDHAGDIGDQDVLPPHAQGHQQVQAGQGGGPGPGGDQTRLLDLLAHQHQAIADGGGDDDGGAVLVVVEDRDLHPRLEGLLDDEAVGGLDVLQVDPAEGGLQPGDGLDELLRVPFVDLDIEDIDIGELLEEDRLALHHRLGGQGADGPQAQDGGAVADHRHQVATGGVVGGGEGIGGDLLAGRRHAGGIGQGQVALIGQGLGGLDRQLARPGITVIVQGALSQFFRHLQDS